MMQGISLIIAYCIGSLPTGFLVARAAGVEDIRRHGSGNIGATNVARVLGKKYFFLIFVLDFFKASACLWWFSYLGFGVQELVYAAAALLIGNGYSLFLGGKGGKGAATTFGVLLALHPFLLAYLAVIWCFVLWLTRTVGVATMAALIAAPTISWCIFHDHGALFYLMLFICVLGLWLHRNNIRTFYWRVTV